MAIYAHLGQRPVRHIKNKYITPVNFIVFEYLNCISVFAGTFDLVEIKLSTRRSAPRNTHDAFSINMCAISGMDHTLELFGR